MNQEFTDKVYLLICSIPAGKVATYGQIASLSGQTNYARAVGYLLKTLPQNTSIPWHRVVNSKGSISFPKSSLKYKEQIRLLKQDGIVYANERINLSIYKWV
jgi:methylated-DNA-protein-cysteine methyltransferase related protein